jgi:hypothetical protein
VPWPIEKSSNSIKTTRVVSLCVMATHTFSPFGPLVKAMARLRRGLRPRSSSSRAARVSASDPYFVMMGVATPPPPPPRRAAACQVKWTPAFADDKCSICLAEFTPDDTMAVLPCLHGFHTACLAEWFRRKPQCPLCRHV